ncbi:MAG TPA: hypothetical protein VFN49_09865, partial [Candidatus Aquilonibacter sp.]|nr:hypothetical protein [Candidatus Aquilonibacter sp.]
SGLTYYSVQFHFGDPQRVVVLTAQPDASGTLREETLALQGVGTMESYDLRKHPTLAHEMLAWTYGANIAADFSGAKLVADYPLYASRTHQAIYRGSLYGYRVSGIALEIMRLQDVAEATKLAKDCSRTECGD